MRSFFLFGLLVGLPSLALGNSLELSSVGEFGGFRLRTSCAVEGLPSSCTIDTASTYSLISANEFSNRYPSLGQVSLGGLTGIAFNCDQIQLGTFSLAGLERADSNFLRCHGFPDSVSPMIGIDFFRDTPFTLKFSNRELIWGGSAGAREQFTPFAWEGKNKAYITFPGTIESLPANMFFDTGAPVTMVAKEFIAAHPLAFRLSLKEPSEMMKRLNFKAYELVEPIRVNGVPLQAEFIYGADLSPIVGSSKIDVVLGANHLVRADWYFDLETATFSVTAQ